MNGGAPFRPGAVLALVGIGTALFVAMLWMIGAGMVHGTLNNGGAHGASKGLTGYAALSALLERRGWEVVTARSETQLRDPGLVVLTPPHDAKGAEIARIVAARRRAGPTLIIVPKWMQQPLPQRSPGKPGWVSLAGAAPPRWQGFLDTVSVTLRPEPARAWTGHSSSGLLPEGRAVLSGGGPGLVPLAATSSGRVIAAYLDDGGHYPRLAELALDGGRSGDADSGLHPLVLVFEPDLLNNYGLASRDAGLHALALFEVLSGSSAAPRRVMFDLTFNGFQRSANLLTLAFTPPFLAATLCLLLAALAVGWRASVRFGPPRTDGPAIAFGKRALVENAGGIIRRSGRLHLLAAPYAALMRDRLVHELALPRGVDASVTEAAIDRLAAVRAPSHEPFSRLADALRAARRPAELLRAAQALHVLERMLKR